MKTIKKVTLFIILFFAVSVLYGNGKVESNSTNASGIDPSVQFHSSQIIVGQNASSFGMNTANIGDFNADGYEDFAITAERENNSAGTVYIYFGGDNADTRADLVFKGTGDWQDVGRAVSSAGDFNGDGFDDFMITTSNSGTNNPKVELYYGGPNYDIYPDVTFTADYRSVSFGSRLAKLGDINGDGFDDVAVTNSTINIFLGQSEKSTALMPSYIINGYGDTFAFCGDINGDGFEDVLVGNGGINEAYIFAGGENFDVEPDVVFKGSSGSGFGYSLAGGGDINNDGFSDVVIGASSSSTNGTNSGSAYVLLGNSEIFVSYYLAAFGYPTNYTFNGSTENERFGNAVAIVKDMNGDGFDEIAVGENFGFLSSGQNKVFIYNGGELLNSTPAHILNSNDKGSLAFRDITSIDYDGDGYNEVVAGDYSFDVAFIYKNKFSGSISSSDITFPFHYRITSGFDFNGDGLDDFLTGNIFHTYFKLFLNVNNSISATELYSFSGKANFIGDVNKDGFDDILFNDNNNFKIFWGNAEGRIEIASIVDFGNTESYVMTSPSIDVNGDGFDDIIIEKYIDSDNREVIIFYGGRTLSTEADFSNPFEENYSVFMDANGDGFDDLIIKYFGAILVHLGTPEGISTEANMLLNIGTTNFNISGSKFDANGDGFDDLIFENVNDGTTQLYLGSITPFSEKLELPFTGSYSLIKGDYNNDGIDDVIASDGDMAGQIYYGGKNFPSTSGLGLSIIYEPKTSGDINGDGYDDIIAVNSNGLESKIFLTSQINSSPRIVSIKDVPADQGGKVTLSWFKSGFDGTKVTSYQIERSIAPIGIGFAWEVIGNVPASHFNYYSYTASTLNDQTPENIGNTYFRITALTENNDIYYRSNIMYGHSTDNLAPNQVLGLAVNPTPEGIKVSWKQNNESDFKEYKIYRSLEEEVNFDILEVYGTSTDSTFVDKTPIGKSTYYFVRGTDIHENIGVSSSVYLSITGVNESDVLPTEFALLQNYPNPFNPSTTISFALPQQANVKLNIYNSLGEEVAELINENISAGNHQVTFDASNLTSGVYFYRM